MNTLIINNILHVILKSTKIEKWYKWFPRKPLPKIITLRIDVSCNNYL